MTLFDVLVQLFALVLLSETFAPTILARNAKVIWKTTGRKVQTGYHTINVMRFEKEVDISIPHYVFICCCESGKFVSRLLIWHVYLSLSTFLFVSEESMVMYNDFYLELCAGLQDRLQISHTLMDDVSRTLLLNSDFSLLLNTIPASYLAAT